MNAAASGSSLSDSLLGTDSQRLLAVGGLLLVAGGMLFGEYFAIFILHPNNARIGEAMFTASQLVPTGDVDGIMAQFMAVGGFLENRGTKVDTHSHMIHMGYIALLLALLQPWVALSQSLKRRAAQLFVVSGFLLPPAIFSIHYVGLAYSPFSHIGWGSILADFFGATAALAMFIQFWGLWRHSRGDGPAVGIPLNGSGQRASRTLLVGGLLLLVWGFLYGAAYAAWLKSGSGAAEVDILKSIVTNAAADKQELVGEDFAAYGNHLMYRAINVATHTHINEMGILLLLLSFVQSLLPGDQSVRNRWATVAVIGAWGLPVGVLLEIPFGVVGSVIADTSGFLVIIALVVMLLGLLRYAAGGER